MSIGETFEAISREPRSTRKNQAIEQKRAARIAPSHAGTRRYSPRRRINQSIQRDIKNSPQIIAKQQPARRNKQANRDSPTRRPGKVVRLMPAHAEQHHVDTIDEEIRRMMLFFRSDEENMGSQ